MSRLTDAIKLSTRPVAIYRTDSIPADASVPSAHCSIPSLLMKCARTGVKCAADKEHVYCHGALSGFGFGGIPDRERSACNLSVLPEGSDSKHGGKAHFMCPNIARMQLDGIKDYGDGNDAIVFQDLGEAMAEGRDIEVVVFIADPTRISALALLAGFDKKTPGAAMIAPYGHACQQVYAIPRAEGESDDPHAVLGMTDLYARRFIDHDKFTFSVPYKLYLRMEQNVDRSFLGKDSWPDTLGKCI